MNNEQKEKHHQQANNNLDKVITTGVPQVISCSAGGAIIGTSIASSMGAIVGAIMGAIIGGLLFINRLYEDKKNIEVKEVNE